jgi:hypothetical protein
VHIKNLTNLEVDRILFWEKILKEGDKMEFKKLGWSKPELVGLGGVNFTYGGCAAGSHVISGDCVAGSIVIFAYGLGCKSGEINNTQCLSGENVTTDCFTGTFPVYECLNGGNF